MRSRHLDLDKACTRWSRGRGQRCGPSLSSPKGIEYKAARYGLAICSSRERRRCRGWAGWAHSGRCAAQGACPGSVSISRLLFAVYRELSWILRCWSTSRLLLAARTGADCTQGCARKGARLAAGSRRCLVPGSPETRPSRITSHHRSVAFALVDAWHTVAWQAWPEECGQPIRRNRRRLRFLLEPFSTYLETGKALGA